LVYGCHIEQALLWVQFGFSESTTILPCPWFLAAPRGGLESIVGLWMLACVGMTGWDVA